MYSGTALFAAPLQDLSIRGPHVPTSNDKWEKEPNWAHCIPWNGPLLHAGARETPLSKGVGMARLPCSRSACLVLVLLLFASSSLLAADRHGQKAPKPPAASLASRTWAKVESLLARLGSTMDPDGKSQPPVLPTSDLGSTMDPNGGK